MRITFDEADEPEMDYPVLFNITPQCIRVKNKTRLHSGTLKATINRVTQVSLSYQGPVPDHYTLHSAPPQTSDDATVSETKVSNEVTFKSTGLNRLLQNYCAQVRNIMEHPDELYPGEDGETMLSDVQVRSALEMKLKDRLVRELGVLIGFADRVTRNCSFYE